MNPAARRTPTEPSIDTSGPLGTLAEVASRIASDAPPDEMVPAVLERLQGFLDAEQCALWLHDDDGLERRWSVGTGDGRASDVAASLLEGSVPADPRLITSRLLCGTRRIGALSAIVSRGVDDDERVVFKAVGDLLAPAISHFEHSRHLEVEVDIRTRQIEEQRRFTERIIDSLPLGVYVIDREYRICAWNRKRETGMQGVSREEAIGRTIFEILHRQPATVLRREFDDVFLSGSIQQFQTESSATGELKTFRISKVPMRVDDANVSHVITIGEDITEWKEAEARFAQAEKLAAIGQLAAGVMHEINNPLATIAACAESLAMRINEMRASGTEVPAEGTEYLQIIDNEVHRCKRIIDGLLDFSRPKPVVKSIVDVNYILEETLFLLKHHSRFKKIAVRTEFDNAMHDPVLGSREQLIQVFMALLLNALDAQDERGTIVIKTCAQDNGRRVVITEIIDEGHGIARSDVPKIFEPFYTTKPPGRGTGLGLSICYGIVAEHGGRIEVDSAPRKGSTFRVMLPVATDRETMEAIEEAALDAGFRPTNDVDFNDTI